MNMPTGAHDPQALPAAPPAPAARPARADRRAIWCIAAVAFGIEMAVSGRYGYHRDELYFLEAGRHLQLGYVDQPVLTPLLARLEALAFGNTLVGLRVLPALGLSALVLLTAGMSRLLGAGRAGQAIAALATGSSLVYLAAMHLLSTTTPSFVLCALTLYLVMRLLASEDPRWWPAIGVAAGLAAAAKWDIFFLAATLAAGFLATPARRLLRTRYLIAGLAIAAVLAAPDFIWQAGHGWPQLALFRSLDQAAGSNRASYWPALVIYTGLAQTPVWVAGLVWSLRSAAARRFRPVGIASALLLILIFVLGGKAYYPADVLPFLFAAGSVPLERWAARGRAHRWAGHLTGRTVLVTVVLLAFAVLNLPLALPVLPARGLPASVQKINYTMIETIAWPKLVALTARVYDALPSAQRRHTALLTSNYGEAGAIDRYGPGFGLPQAYSGRNSFWFWGPPPAADTSVVAVNIDPALLHRQFTHVRPVATFWNGLGINDNEQGAEIYIATGLKSTWAAAWPTFRHFD
jgi:4-amino-4-deoxy-L-arabinose transferase-like glycosyltransferase